MQGPTTTGNKILVGIPYTVPMPYGRVIQYTKGSGDWQETFACGLRDDNRFDVVTYGPAYENWTVRERPYPWRDVPILYRTPRAYLEPDDKGNVKVRQRPLESEIHVQLPMYGFTRSQSGWGVYADADPQQFRAIAETMRFFTDWLPLLVGRERFDVLFPQHISMNAIVGAHYMKSCGIGISHETCARADMTIRVGGWAATHMRPFVLDSIGAGQTDIPIVAISSKVREMLTDPDGPALPGERVRVIRNPYDGRKFHFREDLQETFVKTPHVLPLSGSFVKEVPSKVRLRESFVKMMDKAGEDFPSDVPLDGRWAVFVGRPEEFKGVEQLLHSWAVHIFNDRTATAKDMLFVIGPELTNSSRMAELAGRLGIRNNVRFLGGRKPIEFINPLHNVSDLAAMTSLGEGDGVVCKEPGATGNRVVYPNSGGPSEYFHPDMGTMVASRDPDLPHSSLRGFELLSGSRSIKWGRLELQGSEIVTDYIGWRRFYGGAQMSASLTKGLETLEVMARRWNYPEVQEIRNYAATVLESEGVERNAPYVPEEPRAQVELLARAFREYGGRDVEAHDLARGYSEELDQPPAELARRSRLAREYVVKNFSSSAHAREVGDLLFEAAQRPFQPEAPESWEGTAVQGFAEGAHHALTANISDRARSDVHDAFMQLMAYRTDQELINGLSAFMKGVTDVLGRPDVYPMNWPTPRELGMRYNLRTPMVLANIGGFKVEDYLAVQRRIIDDVAVRPELQTALYYMQTGQMDKVKQMLAAGSGGNLPSSETLVATGLV